MKRIGKIQRVLLGGMVLLLNACNIGAEEVETTLSSEEVLQTAQAIAELTRSAITATFTPLPATPTETVPPESPTPANTPTPGTVYLVADYNANIRRGPGEVYEVIDVILQGQEADVVGRYDGTALGTWWYVTRRGQGLDGWVWSGAVTVYGNQASVPYQDAPPTSTPSPEPTSPPAPTNTPTLTATP